VVVSNTWGADLCPNDQKEARDAEEEHEESSWSEVIG
jgi:hypothetical protein